MVIVDVPFAPAQSALSAVDDDGCSPE